VVGHTLPKHCMEPKGGPGFNPHGLHIILKQQPNAIQGCHVAAHDWATWHQNICQDNATCHQMIRPNLPIDDCHVTCPVCHISMYSLCHVILYGHATSASVRTVRTAQSALPFFSCLTIRTDRDISRSRCPFETKRVALGSQRRGLRSRSF
jgi:hypothetical protein